MTETHANQIARPDPFSGVSGVELISRARSAALDLYRRFGEDGTASLTQAELKILGWSVRLLELAGSGAALIPRSPGESDAA